MNFQESMRNLQNDQEFIEKLGTTEDPVVIQELLKEKGIEMSIEDIQEAIKKSYEDNLTEEDLDNVAGGFGIAIGICLLAAAIGFARGSSCKK